MTTFKPLTKETWPNLQILFGDKGACGGCWCMYWRLAHKEYENGKGNTNKSRFFDLIEKELPLGVLAFYDDEPVGWCSISPKSELVRLKNSRLFKTIETIPAWSITCLYIHKKHRNKGMSSELIAAATEYALENGATTVEAYPIIPKAKRTPPAFAWVGFANSFIKSGFKEVIQASENRLIVRLEK